MAVSSDVMNHLFSLPPGERFVLAQQLLDSINDVEAARYDEQFSAELKQRREDMIRGEEIVPDWRAAISEIEQSFCK
jgi:Putative addiction module component